MAPISKTLSLKEILKEKYFIIGCLAPLGVSLFLIFLIPLGIQANTLTTIFSIIAFSMFGVLIGMYSAFMSQGEIQMTTLFPSYNILYLLNMMNEKINKLSLDKNLQKEFNQKDALQDLGQIQGSTDEILQKLLEKTYHYETKAYLSLFFAIVYLNFGISVILSSELLHKIFP